jgi:Family of unknown function (DUF6130)
MRSLRMFGIVLVVLFSSIQPAAAAGPALTVMAPENGAVVEGPKVTVQFKAADFKIVPSSVPVSEFGKRPDANRPGEGHVHFALDAQPLVVWFSADAYTFQDVAPGQHQLMVELVNNDHSSLTPQVMQMIHFQVGPRALPTTGAEPATALPRTALLVLAFLLMAAGWLTLRRRSI